MSGLSHGSNAMHTSPAGTPNAAPMGGPFIPSQSGMGGLGGPGGIGGPGTPTRGGHGGAPSVIISPSQGNAPVCFTLQEMSPELWQ